MISAVELRVEAATIYEASQTITYPEHQIRKEVLWKTSHNIFDRIICIISLALIHSSSSSAPVPASSLVLHLPPYSYKYHAILNIHRILVD